ncbi:uncharacterized protein BDW43DRAFT_295968 [Aspergillus alliaceus]|uniref:uncharacterized protein n=1 Tax=Petromyces alliaceus TaxID=209559 RepID=UPI0012A59921|nr:uncharacterized protein BDW43DRAFT_295968 [Aspergillus alliaceus]KAB8239575.1 hypothetical protein BDW43DRAFT_295968 [Aspergillus alliaceus]
MTSNTKVDLNPVPSLDLQSLPDERSTSLFTPGPIYHNHMPHVKRIISLRNPNDGLLRTGITKDNRRQFLGTEMYTLSSITLAPCLTSGRRYTAAYTEFFDQELFNKHDNWKALVNEYLFSFPEPLMHGFTGILPELATEALSFGCTERNPIPCSLDSPYPDISTYKSTSSKEILCRSAWDIVDPAEQFKEAVHVAGILFTESRDEAGSSAFVPEESRVGVLRQFWLFVLYVFVARLSPRIGDGEEVRRLELEGRDWSAFGMLKEWFGENDGWYLKATVRFVEEFQGWIGIRDDIERKIGE